MLSESFTHVRSVTDIEIPIGKPEDIDEASTRHLVAVSPSIGIFYLVVSSWGRDFGKWFPGSSGTLEIAIQAQLEHYILKTITLWALVNSAIFPVLMVFNAKEMVV